MKRCFRRGLVALLLTGTLAGCGNRETKKAVQAARVLEDQKQYQDADDVLVAALSAREAVVRGKAPEEASGGDLTKAVQADPEMLKLEREQVPIYLHLQRPDLASAVYADILAGDAGSTVVFEMAKDHDPAIRAGAMRVLGLAGQAKAIGALAEATKDADRDVRQAAVAALGTIKDPSAVPPLIEALKDSYWFVRSDAADALGRERDARAVDPLMGMIGDPDKTAESAAENALVLLASTPGISGDVFAAKLGDSNPKVVTVAAVCLTVQKDARATPVLIRLAGSSDTDVRLHAVKALGAMGDGSAIPVLRGLLHDPDVNVRGWTIIGLGKLSDSASLPDLRAIAADANEPTNIRDAATAAVNHISGVPAPEAGTTGTP